jgi:hypothetical protein
VYERALKGYDKTFGPEEVDCYNPALNTMENTTSWYIDLKRLVQARVYMSDMKLAFSWYLVLGMTGISG